MCWSYFCIFTTLPCGSVSPRGFIHWHIHALNNALAVMYGEELCRRQYILLYSCQSLSGVAFLYCLMQALCVCKNCCIISSSHAISRAEDLEIQLQNFVLMVTTPFCCDWICSHCRCWAHNGLSIRSYELRCVYDPVRSKRVSPNNATFS